MNGQNFAFNGYLPIDKAERKSKIKQLERRSFEEQQSQLFIETPYRNNSILEDLSATLYSRNPNMCGLRFDTTIGIYQNTNSERMETFKNRFP